MGCAALVVRERAESPYDVEVREAEVIEDLGDEIALLAAHIHAATHRLLVLIARFDAMRGWEPSGHRDCAHWLSSRTGIDLGAAREKVRAARALTALPETSAAMARGELSFSKVRALTRVATAENEGALLRLALGSSTAQLERIVRAWKRGSREDEAKREERLHASRTLSVFPDDEGMYVIHGRLTPEVGALLMRALEAASAAPPNDPKAEPGQRRADALGQLVERALARDGDDAPISGARAARFQVVLHVEAETLQADGDPGRSELEDGTRVSAETARRLSCDASLVRVAHNADGDVLDVGRKTRTVPPAIRRALEVRDRGCRFPGCGLRFTDAHHVRHWADGGGTSVGNCLLLCGHHHRLVHEGGWQVHWSSEGLPVFFDRRGGAHFEGRWEPPKLPDQPVAALIRENRVRGASPDAWTASARWEREEEIPDEVYFAANEAASEAF